MPLVIRLTIVCLVVLAASATAPAVALAQEPENAEVEAELWAIRVIRPDPEVRELARRVAVQLRRRTGEDIEVGDAPPEMLEVVPAGHLAMATVDGKLRVVLGGAGGRFASAEMVVEGVRSADVRAVALAVEALHDQLRDADESLSEALRTVEAGGTTWTIVDAEALTRPRGPERRSADWTVYGSVFLGISALDAVPLVGPSLGAGLCLGPGCFVFEVDVPLVATEHDFQGDPIRYRPADLGARVILRKPFPHDLLVGGSIGVVTRIGRAVYEAGDRDLWVNSLGIRASGEGVWRFAAPWELVFELGVDFIADPARFIQGVPMAPPESVPLDETWRLWILAELRARR